MLISGRWTLCDDGIVRPVIEGEVLASDGSWLPVELLVDVGADRTVLTAGVLATLALPQLPSPNQLGGVGGAALTVAVATHLRLPLAGGASVTFQGSFACFTEAEALDMCVLGRDIMNLFAVIIDRPGDAVCMIGQGHGYAITTQP
jgi:hypothetical protein